MSTTNSKAIQPSTAACCGTNDSKPASKRRQEWSYTPAIDAYELPDAYVIEVDAPGVRADGIDLTFEAGVLHVHGEVAPRHGENLGYLRQEYGVGDFDREVPLGRLAEWVDGTNAEATYSQGVLTIRLPKLEVAQAHRIEVKKNPA